MEERVHRAPVSLLGRLFFDIVERRAGNPSFVERLVNSRVLHDGTTSRVDEDGRLLHSLQRFPIEQVARLRSKRRLDHEIVRTFNQFVKGNGPHVVPLDLGLVHERIVRPDVDAECAHSLRDVARDGAERQKTENAAAQALYWVSRLPPPFTSPDRLVVLGNLASGGEPEGDGMVSDFLGTPFVRGVRYLYSAPGGSIDIDNIDASTIACNHATARHCIDNTRADARVLSKDTVNIASFRDDFVFALTLRVDEFEARPLNDCTLDVHVAEIVVGDQDRPL